MQGLPGEPCGSHLPEPPCQLWPRRTEEDPQRRCTLRLTTPAAATYDVDKNSTLRLSTPAAAMHVKNETNK